MWEDGRCDNTLFKKAQQTSLRKAKQGRVVRSIHRKTKKKLKLSPYNFHVVFEYLHLPADPIVRGIDSSRGMTTRVFTLVFFLAVKPGFRWIDMWMVHNYRRWFSTSQCGHIAILRYTHEKIGVWCALSRKRIVDPIFSPPQLRQKFIKIALRRS